MKTTIIATITSILIGSALNAAEISLLDQPVKEYKVGFGDLWIGRNLDKKTVTLQGKEITITYSLMRTAGSNTTFPQVSRNLKRGAFVPAEMTISLAVGCML